MAVQTDNEKEHQQETQDQEAEMKRMVDEVREMFLTECRENKELYDDYDIERVSTCDWQIERFIRRKKTVVDSFEMLKNTLQWRHQYELGSLKDSDFSEEFYKIGTIFSCGKDKDGNAMIYMRIRLHRRIKLLERKIKQFIMYNFNKVDRAMNGKNVAVVFDCKGAGISNLDMDILWFMVDSLIKYYPCGMNYVLVYELPWILASTWTIVKGWLPPEQRDKIKFASKDQIYDYVDQDNLPYYLGGGCKTNYRMVPKDCLTAEEILSKDGFSEKDMQRIIKVFKPLLEEAEEEIRELNAITA